MERSALQELIQWNDNKRRKPLILWGARQVGKTYLIRDMFANTYYKENNIYVDFKKDDEIREFCSQTANAKKIAEYLSLLRGKQIDENTLLVFDEIQECPNIISSLKYFCQDLSEIPVIATGSMVRIKIQRETNKRGSVNNGKFLFPVGKINQMTLYPLTFDEFLMNSNKMLYDVVLKAYESKTPLDSNIHELAMEQVYKYLLVGGMPEAVAAYIETDNFLTSREILMELYDNYLADMQLYQASSEAILRSHALFQNIYKELNKESKNFSPGLIERNSKTRDFATSIQWLTLAHIVNQSFQLKEHVTMPLIPDDLNSFRLYLADIGMFSYQSGINAASFISSERENTLSGIFFENFVANELVAKGHKLFYWRGKASAEIEFIIESNNRIYPIDVKKGRGVLNSLEKFSNHNKFECAIKVSGNNYGYNAEKKLLTIPFYFISFLAKDLAKGIFNANKY
ncbi:MAG TPA: AAA family ATPase [Clostridia bacterium]|nr:ATP-binding protein [Clostridiaceae bacterium]HOF27168.1 AAA family ATPase [Clostridia bacterium]HOM34824.1 AAA family ATPase [Clostridia bacterium]HOR90001.1 AAA family ATPase [Clostridia bacterium]HOT71297.1 AAA family ATPase [Clostridia bacterium]